MPAKKKLPLRNQEDVEEILLEVTETQEMPSVK
jgi:hypothetical protein